MVQPSGPWSRLAGLLTQLYVKVCPFIMFDDSLMQQLQLSRSNSGECFTTEFTVEIKVHGECY